MKRITPQQYTKLVRKSLTPADDTVSGFSGRIQDTVVSVPGKRNWIYVTLSRGGALVQARNRFAPPAWGMAVILEPIPDDPLRWQVRDVRPTSTDDFDFVLLANHATNHDWQAPDETRTDLRQFLPLRVLPAAAGGIAVDIHAGRYETAAGKSALYAGVTTLSISGYQPAAGSVWLLIELDNAGVLKYSTSTNKPTGTLAESDIPARTAERMTLAAVKLYGGQTVIRDGLTNPDILDLRLSNGGSALGFLKLDQTTPQTVTGGVPVFDDGLDAGASKIVNLADPVNPNDAVNLHYLVDHAGFIQEYFTHGSSVMSTTYVESETPDVETLNATPVDTLTLFYKSAVADTPTPFTLNAGSNIDYHFSAKASAVVGVKVVTLQMRLFYVDADGTSNKTAVAGISDASAQLTTTKTYYELHSHLAADLTVPSGKRLWIEIYANTSGVSVNYPDVSIYRDSINNHITFGVSGAILANFVPLTRIITATAPITIAGTTSADLSADRTIAIIPATTLVPGSMSAADKGKLDKIGDGITAGKVLTLTATDNFNLTIPASGTAALLATINAFTKGNSITVSGVGTGAFDGAMIITQSITNAQSMVPRCFMVDSTFVNDGTATASDARALNFQMMVTGTGTKASIYGVFGNSIASQTSGTTASVTGGNFSARNNNAGTLTNGMAIQCYVMVQSTGNMTTGYVFSAAVPTLSSSGTITDLYGFHSANQGNANVTNSYAFYAAAQSGSTALNYAWYSNAGLVHFGDSVDLASGKNITMIAGNIVADTTTGVSFGSAITQKISFYGKTPIVQRASADQAAAPAGGTGATAGAYDTAAHRDTMITLVNEMRLALIAFGLIKGSA